MILVYLFPWCFAIYWGPCSWKVYILSKPSSCSIVSEYFFLDLKLKIRSHATFHILHVPGVTLNKYFMNKIIDKLWIKSLRWCTQLEIQYLSNHVKNKTQYFSLKNNIPIIIKSICHGKYLCAIHLQKSISILRNIKSLPNLQNNWSLFIILFMVFYLSCSEVIHKDRQQVTHSVLRFLSAIWLWFLLCL